MDLIGSTPLLHGSSFPLRKAVAQSCVLITDIRKIRAVTNINVYTYRRFLTQLLRGSARTGLRWQELCADQRQRVTRRDAAPFFALPVPESAARCRPKFAGHRSGNGEPDSGRFGHQWPCTFHTRHTSRIRAAGKNAYL